MILSKPVSVKEIAEIIQADFCGEGSQKVSGINEIHRVIKGDLTFADHPKYIHKALYSNASVILLNNKVPFPEGKSIIISNDPFRDFNILTKSFYHFEKCSQQISSTAHIGENTIIQPGVFIGNHVKIGKDCCIHSNVSINDHVVIGNRVIIHSNTVIGSDAFYYKRRPSGYDKLLSCGRVVIEDDVEIGANCTIDRGVSSDTIIGQGTKMDNLVQVAHDVRIGKHCLFASQVGIAGAVTIEDHVILWGQVGVNKDLSIGKNAVVLGQSGIAKSLKGNKIYFGSPVSEAREKMKELIYIKKLPEIIKKVYNLS